MKKKFFSIQIILSFLVAQSRGIEGTILQQNTLESLENANIFLEENHRGTSSDKNGFFSIHKINPGTYTLIATHIGFKPWKQEIQIIEDNPVILEIKLIPTTIEWDSIEVSMNRNQKELLQGQHRLSSQFIRRIPSAGEPDLLRALQTLPGVTSTNDFNVGFYVRGGNRDQNLLLLDDMPIFNPFHMSGIFSTFDPDAVQSVDFQKGGLHPEYGNHLSSVININLRDGKANKKSLYTNVSLMSSRFRWEGPIKKGSYMVSIRRTYIDLILDVLRFIKVFPPEIVLPYNFIDGIGKLGEAPYAHIQNKSFHLFGKRHL